MKYETQILEAYKKLGFQPRDRQVEAINEIVVSFLDEGITTISLSAPTGTGKSIIGAVCAEVLHQIKNPDTHNNASFLLTGQNVLAQQYADTFADQQNPYSTEFVIVAGANNYECAALSTPTEIQTGEACSIGLFQKTGLTDLIENYCEGCEFKRMKSLRPQSRHLITNYSWYFVDRMYTQMMEKRTLCVFDEAHLLNDLFVEHNAIYFSERRIEKYVEEISENLKLGNTEIFKMLKMIKEHLVAGKITSENYRPYVTALCEIYNEVSGAAKLEADRCVKNAGQYLKMLKMHKKYFGLGCKIGDLLLFNYPCVFEYKEKDPKKGQAEHEASVKAIFIGDMFSQLINADYNLLMSATISEKYLKQTMAIPGKTKHIRLAPSFPKENKQIVFYKTQSLNYETMKDKGVIEKLCRATADIVTHHTQMGDRGIILCPSFAVAELLSNTARSLQITKVFEHQRGTKLADVLEQFKCFSSGPAVLITPSGFEGVDLPGDLSKYQIIVKMPFASLGDERIKTILRLYPSIYGIIALKKVVQGAGRSVRSATDSAITYCLDSNIQRAWSKDNEWADEFSSRFSSTLQLISD